MRQTALFVQDGKMIGAPKNGCLRRSRFYTMQVPRELRDDFLYGDQPHGVHGVTLNGEKWL